jgi:hypothetical protein
VTASPTSPTSSSGRPSARRTAGQRPTGSRGALRRPASGESASRGVSGKRRATVLRPSRPDSLRPHCLLAPADAGRTADRLTTAQKVTSSRTVAHRRIGIGTLAGARNANGPRLIPGDRWGTEERPALTARQPSEHEKPWNFQGFSRAADGTRTHDLLHGKQKLSFREGVGKPCKSATFCRPLEKRDARRFPRIHGDLANQWQTVSSRRAHQLAQQTWPRPLGRGRSAAEGVKGVTPASRARRARASGASSSGQCCPRRPSMRSRGP